MAPMERRRSELGRSDSVGGSNVVEWEVLPITQRGLFQRDDFFQAHRESFDAAVQRVLQRFGEDTSSSTGAADTNIPLLRRYRRLRSTQTNKEDTQVVTQLEDDQHHKIVLDVRDFMSGDLSVKVAPGDAGEVVVHGVVNDEATTSASGVGEQRKRTFTHKFNLPPSACSAEATSAISSDGVLTIIAPKRRKPRESKAQPNDDGAHLNASETNEAKGNNDGTKTPEAPVRQRRRQREPVTTNNSMEGLPIVRRGNFFEDSIFEDTQEDFNEAIREILESTGEISTDDYMSYRRLRARDLNEDNQAVTEIEDGKQLKILIDVKDFMTDGEVKVKALNEKDLIVEGFAEKDDDETVSIKSFSRRFSLPENAEIDAITSVVSSDGVLAITTPKTTPPQKEIETIIPITIEGSVIQPTVKRHVSLNRKESLNREPVRRREPVKKTELSEMHGSLKKTEPLKRAESLKSPQPLRKREPVKRSESLKKIEFLRKEDLGKPSNLIPKPESKEHIIPVQLEDDTQKDEVDTHLEKEATTSKGDKNEITKPDTSSNDSKNDIIVRRRNTSISPILKKDASQSDSSKYLPIEQRGMFFSDSFFDDVQSQYKAAVGEVLKKSGFTSNNDDMSFYRLLRERSQTEDSQVASLSFDDHYHKIIVDVKDFIEGDVNIKIVSDNELELEGQQDKTVSNEPVIRNFKRRFIFPKSINMSSINCSISADGVIVIKAIKPSTDKSENGNENAVQSILLTDRNNSEINDIPPVKEAESDLKKPINEISESKEVQPIEAAPKKDTPVNKVTSGNKELSDDKNNTTNKETSTIKDNSTSKDSSSGKDNSKNKDTSTVKDNSTNKDSSTTKDNSKNRDTSNNKDKSTNQDAPEIKLAEEGTILPISKKGSFFSDSFFEEAAQRNLQTAVREVLNKTGLSAIDDDFKFYRNMREKSTNEETQAVNSIENDKSYKIVIDVQGYDENNVKVMIVSDKEILVNGQQEIKDRSNTATRIFRRRFVLSNSVKTASVVSAVSSDGILTITAPKKVATVNGMKGKKEVSSSISINSKNPKKVEAVHQVSSEETKKL
ncbi:unnamed protein product [Meganyctiphanes norvegica]|uniref:SHSP domain-containing protein n=1 Tax=Meganyctiphanes norvegica TaxID=48144 RepID=A0AAV2RCA5_MEGNR